MKFNFKKIVTAACMAAFLATSFLPGISEPCAGTAGGETPAVPSLQTGTETRPQAL